MTLGLTLLAWVFLVRPYQMDDTHSVVVRILASAYAVGDVIILGVLARLLLPGTLRGTPAWLVSIGIITALLADIATGLIYVYGVFGGAQWVALGWAVCYAFWGAAALHPGMTDMTVPCQIRKDKEKPDPQRDAAHARVLLLVLAALIAPVVLFVKFFFTHSIVLGVTAGVCGWVFLLVLAPPVRGEPHEPPEPDQGADAADGGGTPGIGGDHRGDRDRGTGRDRRPPRPRPRPAGRIAIPRPQGRDAARRDDGLG